MLEHMEMEKVTAGDMASCLEDAIKEYGVDEPEGSETCTFSVTLVRLIIQALRGQTVEI